jgi:hypothetical protein
MVLVVVLRFLWICTWKRKIVGQLASPDHRDWTLLRQWRLEEKVKQSTSIQGLVTTTKKPAATTALPSASKLPTVKMSTK